MTRGRSYSQRNLSRWMDWLVEVTKLILILAFLIAGLSTALWSVLGINPFTR